MNDKYIMSSLKPYRPPAAGPPHRAPRTSPGRRPYKVDEFRANDVIVFSVNEHYRESGKPASFATVTLKGSGDATSAARAVLATGEFDYARNLQVEPEVLEQVAAAGKGTVVAGFGTMVERLVVNQTDSTPDLGPEARSLHLGGTNAADWHR